MAGDAPKKDKGNETNVPRDDFRTVGQYQLIRELGQGGMGTVYEATHECSGQKVALKLMSKRLVQGEAHRKRFDREMTVATMLDHPGITSLLDFGEHEGEPYYVMEYVEGWPSDAVPQEILLKLGEQAATKVSGDADYSALLAGGLPEHDRPQEQPRPSKKGISGREKTELVLGKSHFSFIAGLALQAADALHYAHKRGVIHRDIKPSNLMLTPEGKVKILDFGLAKAVDLETLTTTGDFFGTPAYMSPEQAAGEVSQIDQRSDVYSLGVTLYQLLTSTAPFTGEARVVTSAILHKEPVEPRKLNRQIPKALNAVVSKAIEKRREDRYQSAKELADDLRRYLSGSKVKARQGSLSLRLAKSIRKRKKEAILVLSSLLLTAIAFAAVRAHLSKKRQRYENLIAAATDLVHKGSFGKAIAVLEEGRRVKDTTEVELKLWDARGKLKRLLPGSSDDRVYAVAFSPGGRFLACGEEERFVRVWDMNFKGERSLRFSGHRGNVTAVCFSPDDKLLASADASGAVVVRDTITGKEVSSSKGADRATDVEICSMAFMPGSKELFIAGTDGRIALLNLESPDTEGRSYEGAERFLGSQIRANQVGDAFAAACEGWAGTFNMASGLPSIYLSPGRGAPSAITASASGNMMALGYPDGIIDIYSEGGDSPQASLECGKRPVKGLCFFEDGKKLLSCSDRGTVAVWDLSRKRREVTIADACGEVRAMAAARTGRLVALAPMAGGVHLWETDADQVQPSGKVLMPASYALSEGIMPESSVGCFSVCANFVASGDTQGTITVWDARTGRQKNSINDTHSCVTALAFSSKKEGLLAYGSRDKDNDPVISIYDTDTSREIHRFSRQRDVVCCLAFNEDGRLLASGDRNSHVILRDLATMAEGEPTRVAMPGHVVIELRFAGTRGDALISWTTDGRARFWKVRGLMLSPATDAECEPVGIDPARVAIGPGGHYLATVSKTGGKVGVWDVRRGRGIEFTPFRTTRGVVRCLGFSHNGKIIASGDQEDLTVKLWSVEQEREAISLRTEPELPNWLAFDRSSSRLAVGLTNGKVFLYDSFSP